MIFSGGDTTPNEGFERLGEVIVELKLIYP